MTEAKQPVVSEDDLNSSGRKANTNLGNFRLLGKSKHQQYYTPNDLAETIYEMLRPALNDGKNAEGFSVLDPTCGSARLLLPWKKAKASVIGIELDREAANVAKRVIGKENVRVGDLLDYAVHLENFDIAVINPPYGIFWQIGDNGLSFDSECYGGSIESQAATIEITTMALTYTGIMAAIIPTSTFSNAKDKKLRDHIYNNYNILFRATLDNLFKKEYGINVQVDMLIAQKNSWEQDKLKGEKAIIFSGLRPMVTAMTSALTKKGIGILPILATHKTSQRFEMIEKFSHDEHITAIVAGLNVLNRGFTIIAANNVIITDIEYSPESTLQAEDRSHRTGQNKEVNVYYLLSRDSIDEVMFDLVSKKQSAISKAIDAKPVHTDVAKLLESLRGNIQLEVARKIVEATPAIHEQEPEIEEPEPVSVAVCDGSWKERYEEFLKQKIEMEKNKATRTKPIILDSRQLGLF